MHVEYRVCLPDHYWVVAESHKLIPSVIAGIEIGRDGLGIAKVMTSGLSSLTHNLDALFAATHALSEAHTSESSAK